MTEEEYEEVCKMHNNVLFTQEQKNEYIKLDKNDFDKSLTEMYESWDE